MSEKIGLNSGYAFKKNTTGYINEECGVIMGGGKGERLHPDTLDRPKQLQSV